MTRRVICPYCQMAAELVDGSRIYPYLPALHARRFWLCAPCDAYVGCHKANPRRGRDGTQPLGRLANRELRREKQATHAAFDPLWQQGYFSRQSAYAWLAARLGITQAACHIGMFDVELCQRAREACLDEMATLRGPARIAR